MFSNKTRNWNCLKPPSPRSLVLPQVIAESDSMTFTPSMLNFRRLVRVSSGASIWSLLVKPVAWKSYMNGMLECKQILEYRQHKILGADCAVSSLETGGLHCETFHPIVGQKRALEWQPRAKRVGRRPNTWVTKNWGNLRGGSGGDNWQDVAVRKPCAVGAINAWVCTVCPR